MSAHQNQLAFRLDSLPDERRVACVVLPELASELARWATTKPTERAKARPLGVVLMDGVERHMTLAELNRAVEPNFRLSAVDAFARRLGITAGQTIVEARCLHAGLEVIALPRSKIAETLGKIAESLLDRASIVAIEAPDTIWLEIGPVMRALGGEAAVANEIIERVRCLGHAVRLAVATGPRLAQLFARWAALGAKAGLLVPQARSLAVASTLPLTALPLSRNQLGWLGQLGLVSLGDLLQLPEGELVDRLGRDAGRFIALARGEDNEPLFPLQPERILREGLEWEEPVEGLERLRFVLRRLTTNLESRLAARGEAAERLGVTLHHDNAIARHRGTPNVTQLQFELARPLWYAEDLERIIVTRCERTELLAPIIALELKVIAPTPKVPKQLELGRLVAGYGSSAPAEEGLPMLLAELDVDIGSERIGLLRLGDSHRPESKSLFSPCRPKESPTRPQPRKTKPRQTQSAMAMPPSDYPTQAPANSNAQKSPPCPQTIEGITRLLERPIVIEPPIRVGATIFLDHQAYVIERLRFEERLAGIEWWGKEPICRDYWRVFLQGPSAGLEGLIYVEPNGGRCFLQALVD